MGRVTSRVFDNYWIPHTVVTVLWCYNMEGHNHWVSEVVAGIVIGEFIGKMVYENYHEARQDSKSTRSKTERWKRDVSLGQAFGVIGPKFVLSW